MEKPHEEEELRAAANSGEQPANSVSKQPRKQFPQSVPALRYTVAQSRSNLGSGDTPRQTTQPCCS